MKEKVFSQMKKYRYAILIIIDMLLITFSCVAARILLLKSIVLIDRIEVVNILKSILLSLIVYEAALVIARIYRNITRYETGIDYFRYFYACIGATAVLMAIELIVNIPFISLNQIIISGIIISVAIVSYRILIRFMLTNKSNGKDTTTEQTKNLLIIGAGSAARDIIKTLKTTMKDSYNIVGIIDDNLNKVNYAISGISILGSRDKIVEVCNKYNVEVIFFCITEIDLKNKREILEICQKTKAKLRILPSTEEIIKNKNMMQNLRDVEIEDLLGREPIRLDNQAISNLIQDKVVLVTGGGGSIGSELCRQIIKCNPKKLVIFDIYENNLYNIEIELKEKYEVERIEAIVGSVRDKKRLEEVFEKYNPYLVFHAAAHKHVPLMEVSPLEAIKNNVFGTYNVVNCCDKYKVKRFVLISTDKAVNPTNIMGATKRMCEMIVQAKNKVSETEFAAVRFGNVLGSNGSVIPLFKRQIAEGGPVTVTHKEITRFFMTIPEAVQLVLQAMSYAQGGEIFVLDMGEPVKIYDLAESLIKLSGLEPNVDIPIVITGLRPGEKLYEELLMSEEGLEKTAHNKIFVAEPLNLGMKEIEEKLSTLGTLVEEKTNDQKKKIKEVIKQVIPTYREVD